MKNFINVLWLLTIFSGSISAQESVGITGNVNWLSNWTEFDPKNVDYDEETHILTGNITEDVTLLKGNTYLLVGNVFVTNDAILSIEPGTVIKGDFMTKATLTITQGASIIAEGTPTDPIVFTSNASRKKPGDWGGIIIIGDGYTNKVKEKSVAAFYPDIKFSNYEHTSYGGDGLKDNSGFLSYVRVEYAGAKAKQSPDANAILLAGVGVKTVINQVMVSYSGDNSFGIIGGEVNLNKIVSYKAKGIDYNFNYGVKCNIDNALAIRYPFVSTGKSKCIRAVSYENALDNDFSKKGTEITASHMTLLTDTNDLDYAIKSGLTKEAVYIGDHTNFKMVNSVISGFSTGVLFGEKIVLDNTNLSLIKFENMHFNNCNNGKHFAKYNTSSNGTVESWYRDPAFSNKYSSTNHSELFLNLNINKRPDFRLKTKLVLVAANNNKKAVVPSN
ncbi:hypothetical protein MHTCC0001_18500 [Flavobacteriaceae bacterium MHTCC 0001]